MPAFLLSPLFKIGVIALAALGLWGYIAWLKHDAASERAGRQASEAREAIKDSAIKSALASIEELQANESAATAARLLTEGKLDDARKQLAKSRRAVQAAPAAVAQCGLPPKLLAFADSLRKPAPARNGGAGADHQTPASSRTAEAVPSRP